MRDWYKNGRGGVSFMTEEEAAYWNARQRQASAGCPFYFAPWVRGMAVHVPKAPVEAVPEVVQPEVEEFKRAA